MADGMLFYVSKNNVILSSGFDEVIPPKYFKRVVDVKGKVLLEISLKIIISKIQSLKINHTRNKNFKIDMLIIYKSLNILFTLLDKFERI